MSSTHRNADKRGLKIIFFMMVSMSGIGFSWGNSDDQSAQLRDPTTPLIQHNVVHSVSPLKLQAVFSRGSKHRAVVNNQSVAVGDVVAGARIVAIAKHSVTVKRGGKLQTLHLRPDYMNQRKRSR